MDTRENRYIATGCRKWTCEICGPRRKSELIHRITHARPNRFITLTCRHEGEPADQYARMTKYAPRLWTELRKTHGEIEYCRMHESCRDGYPHFHYLARSRFIPHAGLKSLWTRLTGATIVDIRKAHGRSTAYVAKYLTKATTNHGEWSRQRLTASRHFWIQGDRTAEEMIGFEHSRTHPWHYVPEHYENAGMERLRQGVYNVTDREPGDELPEELIGPIATGLTNDAAFPETTNYFTFD